MSHFGGVDGIPHVNHKSVSYLVRDRYRNLLEPIKLFLAICLMDAVSEVPCDRYVFDVCCNLLADMGCVCVCAARLTQRCRCDKKKLPLQWRTNGRDGRALGRISFSMVLSGERCMASYVAVPFGQIAYLVKPFTVNEGPNQPNACRADDDDVSAPAGPTKPKSPKRCLLPH